MPHLHYLGWPVILTLLVAGLKIHVKDYRPMMLRF